MVDMCLSSAVLEDLHGTSNLQAFRDHTIALKEFLDEKAEPLGFVPYKFTGDGWILLFPFDTEGGPFFGFLKDFCKCFDESFRWNIQPQLEKPPDVVGLSFGIDRGPLLAMEMMERTEYVGRAINIACRPQKLVGMDAAVAGQALVSKHCYSHLSQLKEFETVKRRLKNIRQGAEIECVMVAISDPDPGGLAILEATYGAKEHRISVAPQLNKLIHKGRLHVFVGNQLGGDPCPGTVKDIRVTFKHGAAEGKVQVAEARI